MSLQPSRAPPLSAEAEVAPDRALPSTPDRMRRTLISALLLLAVFPAAALALPPRPPSAAQTRAAIRHLKIAQPLSMRGYSRKKFPHWIDRGGGCDTR
jgi:hypothetical protein